MIPPMNEKIIIPLTKKDDTRTEIPIPTSQIPGIFARLIHLSINKKMSLFISFTHQDYIESLLSARALTDSICIGFFHKKDLLSDRRPAIKFSQPLNLKGTKDINKTMTEQKLLAPDSKQKPSVKDIRLLKHYIIFNLESGKQIEEIRKDLHNAGWSSVVIEQLCEGFRDFHSRIRPIKKWRWPMIMFLVVCLAALLYVLVFYILK